jgi:zinc and cadmium transporter
MTSTLGWIIPFSLIGSVGAVSVAALLLVLLEARRAALLPALLAYATGTMLAAAFLGMLPRASNALGSDLAGMLVLAGLLAFFLLDKALILRHCHEADCEAHRGTAAAVLIGDGFHNFVDGLVIAAAFLHSVPAGIAATLAVVAHEIPQEMGDFAVLLHTGMSRGRAFVLNGLSSLTTVPGALVGYFAFGAAREAVPYALAISAASFIYVAVGDLLPTLHRRTGRCESVLQVLLLVAGIATIVLIRHQHAQ